MANKDDARIDWESGMKYKDIAVKYNVSENTVKSWASRYWKKDKKVATKRQKKLQPTCKKLQPSEAAEKVLKAITESVEENDELTEKQKEFCIRYMQNRNATQAYLRVYECAYETARVEGCKSLTKPNIQEELKRLREIKNASLGYLCGEDVVELHMRIAFADITDFVEFKSRRVPITDKVGNITYFNHPQNDEKIMKTRIETEIIIRDSKEVDGTLLTEISQGRDGTKIKLADRMKSLSFLERYFELNPMDKHRKEYDNKRIEIEQKRIKEENNGDELVNDWISGVMGDDNE